MIQNVSGSGLGKVRGGGNVASLRISVHGKKPDFLILPETRIENRDYMGRGVFRGYDLVQHSSSGHRRASVAVFARKNIELIAGTARNSRDGHSTVAGYKLNGNKVILAALYGPSCNNDALSAEVLQGIEDTMGELGQLVGTRNFIMAGDFNIKLHVQGTLLWWGISTLSCKQPEGKTSLELWGF
jgi:exonuclease III